LVARGVHLNNLGLHSAALDSSIQAIKIYPEYAHAWYVRGYAQEHLGFYKDAIISYEYHLNLNPNHADPWRGRGVALAKLGHHEDAITSYDRAINLHPDFAEAWFERGGLLNNLERYEEALNCSKKIISINPGYTYAFYMKGYALAGLASYEEAITIYDQVTKLLPNMSSAWVGRGIALKELGRYDDAITNFDKAILLKNPLNWQPWYHRAEISAILGRIGEAITTYDQGLIYVLQEIQPRGWGLLHFGKGITYLSQAKLSQNIQTARLKYFQSIKCYETALQTLEAFPRDHLDLIQGLIRAYLGLANPEAASQWRIKGLEVFRQLLNAQPTPKEKRRLEAQFSCFSQVAVDALVSAGNSTVALKAAERYKNRCLTWILDEWKEQVTSPSYAEMRGLLNSDREIIYWHLSEETLTTFILTPNQENPIVFTQKSTHFETWQKDWDKCYGDYRSKGKDQVQHLASHPWRNTLKTELARLKDILDIEKIEAHLTPHTQLILIPHRDLHRFPIHALFGDDHITTYLPSIKVGLAQKPPSNPPTLFLLNVEDPARPDQPPLQFARLESAIIQTMFAPKARAINPDDGDRATVETALQEHRGIFHFTGHGDYNARQPEHSAIGLTDTDCLTAKEISALSLQQYGLVCLSACETALTGIQTINTEYVGLTSAFLQAGVSQVVSTLWTVQEVSNAYLMIRFYQFLQNKMNPAEALKRSQSWLRTVTRIELADWLIETSRLKSLDPLIKQELEQQAHSLREEANASTIDLHHPPYAEPYHWAAFTLTGRNFL
jgi:CHAT domain-containing protein